MQGLDYRPDYPPDTLPRHSYVPMSLPGRVANSSLSILFVAFPDGTTNAFLHQ